ncbi:MAG TPA: DinB family protein [Chitinophagaceae bacterium]|jgi:uncharacterized damage-inducible protein DinB|nr:DinB family protein [Chitinophagaceae bacterium]
MKNSLWVLKYAFALASISVYNSSYASSAGDLGIEDSLKKQLIADWTRAKNSTKEFLDAMPEDGINFKPMPEMRSFAEQMLHLSSATMNLVTFATGIQRTAYKDDLEKKEEYKSKSALAAVVMDSYDIIINMIQQTEPSSLFLPSKKNPKFSCYAVLASVYEHQVHHRSQTVVYLRLKGIVPPKEKLF